LKCDYDWPTSNASESSAQNKGSPVSDTDPYAVPSLQTAARLMQALSENLPSSPKSPGPDINIPAQVLSILVANGEGVPSVTSLYFRTIDVWLPIISPTRCIKRLETMSADQNVELACLLLCMYLVTRPPGNATTGPREMQSPLYWEAKTLLSALISAGNHAIEVIQATLLVSLYEQGHGMIEVAQVTMAVCTRLAMRMKVAEQSAPEIQNTEFGRLWWGIIILDR